MLSACAELSLKGTGHSLHVARRATWGRPVQPRMDADWRSSGGRFWHVPTLVEGAGKRPGTRQRIAVISLTDTHPPALMGDPATEMSRLRGRSSHRIDRRHGDLSQIVGQYALKRSRGIVGSRQRTSGLVPNRGRV